MSALEIYQNLLASGFCPSESPSPDIYFWVSHGEAEPDWAS